MSKREFVGEAWIKFNPRHCPIRLRDGDGKSVGACTHYLKDGVCPQHGRIYSEEGKLIEEHEIRVRSIGLRHEGNKGFTIRERLGAWWKGFYRAY